MSDSRDEILKNIQSEKDEVLKELRIEMLESLGDFLRDNTFDDLINNQFLIEMKIQTAAIENTRIVFDKIINKLRGV
jgi:hypothetical protein